MVIHWHIELMARIVRSQVMTLSKQEFILAAEAMGVSRVGIIYKHLIPNAIGPVIVYATLTVPQIMLLEAFLSFLGLGVQAPLSSWGLLIRDGAVSMEEYWWLLIFPSFSFFIEIKILSYSYFFIYLFLTSFILGSAGLVAGLWADKFDHMSTVTNFFIVPLSFLSGTFYKFFK